VEPRPITIPSNGLLFSALETGPPDGPLVVLLHGFPQRATSWTQVATRLGEAGVRSVAVDQRGYSPAARPPDVAAYAMPHLVADAVGIISWLGGSVHLAGHDWGGVVGWQVATRYPHLLQSWTALSTPHPLALAAVLEQSEEQRARFGYILHFRRPGTAESSLLAADGAGLRKMYGEAVAAEQVAADVAFFAQPGVLTAALNWYRAMSPDVNAGLGRLGVPTTFVWGSADPAFGREAAGASGSYVDAPYEFIPLEGAGHWLPDEAADTVADAIARRVLG
jgi:pimeloyl-ACP methyl ester carboxylesterase